MPVRLYLHDRKYARTTSDKVFDSPRRTALSGTIVPTGTASVLVWRDTRQFSPAEGRWGSIYARRVLGH